ncbi:hypothetical protein [Brevibacillus fulvus]|uniref:D-glucuronyl C5-epimerase C-terminal domain-containing protein n=1 Tax=Brevibacillus fulvus TaxID=1125967 RepID=A0A939BSU1_9BACL|nr:hypothetical protein [Brevibacillus fulvus]MBM7588844.1 hypothetical protein [Brevibacillus fulvus]
MRIKIVINFCLLLLVCGHVGAVHAAAANPVSEEKWQAIDNGLIKTKTVRFANGDTYWMKRIEFLSDQASPYSLFIPLSGYEATFRYVDPLAAEPAWLSIPLSTTLPARSGFLQTEQMSMLMNASNLFQTVHSGTVEEQPNYLPIYVYPTAEGYTLEVQIPQQANFVAEVWGLTSNQPLIDWEYDSAAEVIWHKIDLQYETKWSWDGFYVKTPATYTPYSAQSFWRLPTNYAAYWLLTEENSRASDELVWVMLDTALANQNEAGYWETLPQSNWLWQDYGIGPNFFDTRFNTDIASLLLKGYEKYHRAEFLQAAKMYAAFLMQHMNENHYLTYGTQEGWLVQDYGWTQPHLPTHVSLNHQLQEMNFLYQLYLVTEQPVYRDYADKLLYGIKNTGQRWLKPDGNLHYAYLNDGTFGLQDYPYLTYNDLVEAQNLLSRLYGMTDPDLLELMSSKKRWMDENGIYDYRSPEFSFEPLTD